MFRLKGEKRQAELARFLSSSLLCVFLVTASFRSLMCARGAFSFRSQAGGAEMSRGSSGRSLFVVVAKLGFISFVSLYRERVWMYISVNKLR